MGKAFSVCHRLHNPISHPHSSPLIQLALHPFMFPAMIVQVWEHGALKMKRHQRVQSREPLSLLQEVRWVNPWIRSKYFIDLISCCFPPPLVRGIREGDLLHSIPSEQQSLVHSWSQCILVKCVEWMESLEAPGGKGNSKQRELWAQRHDSK